MNPVTIAESRVARVTAFNDPDRTGAAGLSAQNRVIRAARQAERAATRSPTTKWPA
jgi:hypothetical protein